MINENLLGGKDGNGGKPTPPIAKYFLYEIVEIILLFIGLLIHFLTAFEIDYEERYIFKLLH